MSEAKTRLLEQLSALELALQRPEVRGDVQALEALLHPQFGEIGRSGRRYSRAAIIELLLAETPSTGSTLSQDFSLQLLAEDVALLGYRSAHRGADGGLVRHTWRHSIWQRAVDGGWQLRFHQGTPTEPT